MDDMEDVPMADVPGTIATFTIDRLAFSMSPPMVAAVVDEATEEEWCELRVHVLMVNV